MNRNSTIGGILALSLLALPAFAVADNAGDARQIGIADDKPHHHRHHDPVKRTQRHLDQLAGKLNLKDGQQSAWQAYSQAALTRAEARAEKMKAFRARHGEAREQSDAATRMEKMAERMRARAAMLDQMAQDTRAFQQVLSPEQQTIFDLYWKSQRHDGARGHHGA